VLLLAWYTADSIRRFDSKTNRTANSIRDLIRTKKTIRRSLINQLSLAYTLTHSKNQRIEMADCSTAARYQSNMHEASVSLLFIPFCQCFWTTLYEQRCSNISSCCCCGCCMYAIA